MRAKQGIREYLVSAEPYPGEPRIYQPMAIHDAIFDDLTPIRTDSEIRFSLISDVVRETIGTFPFRSLTYCDIGCNTGFFCKRMSDIGFSSTGVDIVPDSISIAKASDSFFYRRYINFICADAIKFIDTMNPYDVVSTFSVFQWIFLQYEDRSIVRNAMLRMMAKSKKIFVLEMGYRHEAHYRETLAEPIDRAWCEDLLDEGGFSDIRLTPEGKDGIKRDMFICIR